MQMFWLWDTQPNIGKSGVLETWLWDTQPLTVLGPDERYGTAAITATATATATGAKGALSAEPVSPSGMTTITLTAIRNQSIEEITTPNNVNNCGDFIPTGYFNATQKNRGILLFDLASLPSDITVTGAVLKITVFEEHTSMAHDLNVYRIKRRLLGPTWNHYYKGSIGSFAWGTAGCAAEADRDLTAIGSVSLSTTPSGTISITLDASAVQELIDGTMLINGFLLVASVEDSNTLVRWYNRLDATPGNRPLLELTYTQPSHSLNEGLVAYWKLDSDSYVDSTGHGYTLTANNTPTVVAGLRGNAAHFVAASAQSLSQASANLMLGDVDWTCTGWFKLTDHDDFYEVVGNRGAADLGWKLFYHKVDVLDYLVAQLNDDSAGDRVISDVIGYNGGNTPVGEWVFFAVRHDAARRYFHLFIDGNEPDATGGHWEPQWYTHYERTPVVDSAAGFNIGRSGPGSASPFGGDIDEVGYWSRWLSRDEILALYNSGVGLDASLAPVVVTAVATATATGAKGALGTATVTAPADATAIGTKEALAAATITALAAAVAVGLKGALGAATISATGTATAAGMRPTYVQWTLPARSTSWTLPDDPR